MGENLFDEEMKKYILFYNQIGFSFDKFLADGKLQNIFDLLKISPFDENGNKITTCYEILGLAPKIENDKEVPIVFVIKNAIKNLKPYRVKTIKAFVIVPAKKDEIKKQIMRLVKNYKLAILQNNLQVAEECLKLLDELTSGNAEKYLGYSFDYSRFYLKMQKQLLIDIFNHFFLKFIEKQKHLVKNGIILRNKKFKPYIYNKSEKSATSINNQASEMIKSISLDGESESKVTKKAESEVDFDKIEKFDAGGTSRESEKDEKQSDAIIEKQTSSENKTKNNFANTKSFINKKTKIRCRPRKKKGQKLEIKPKIIKEMEIEKNYE